MLDRITPLILTRDEEANIERALAQLAWAHEVVLVDSHSTDATLDIARRFSNVRILRREIDSLAGQSNHGMAQVRTPWAMLLDADYVVPPALVEEMRSLEPPADVDAYRGSFVYAVAGRPLRASLYPPRIVLLRPERARVWQDGHAHRVAVEGRVENLRTPLVHDDRKGFARFLERQRRYMREEADKLRALPFRSASLPARARKLVVVAPFAVLLHALVVKGLILDGRAGLQYGLERFVAEAILSWELIRRWKSPAPARS